MVNGAIVNARLVCMCLTFLMKPHTDTGLHDSLGRRRIGRRSTQEFWQAAWRVVQQEAWQVASWAAQYDSQQAVSLAAWYTCYRRIAYTAVLLNAIETHIQLSTILSETKKKTKKEEEHDCALLIASDEEQITLLKINFYEILVIKHLQVYYLVVVAKPKIN